MKESLCQPVASSKTSQVTLVLDQWNHHQPVDMQDTKGLLQATGIFFVSLHICGVFSLFVVAAVVFAIAD